MGQPGRLAVAFAVKLAVRVVSAISATVKLAVRFVSAVCSTVILAICFIPAVIYDPAGSRPCPVTTGLVRPAT